MPSLIRDARCAGQTVFIHGSLEPLGLPLSRQAAPDADDAHGAHDVSQLLSDLDTESCVRLGATYARSEGSHSSRCVHAELAHAGECGIQRGVDGRSGKRSTPAVVNNRCRRGPRLVVSGGLGCANAKKGQCDP
jgi:hypothetical protein